MFTPVIRFAAVAFSLVPILVSSPAYGADGPYHFLKSIPISGEGGWDYLAVDEVARRLYVSHATKVVVLDLDRDAVVGEITGTPGVHGIALAPALGRGFTSNGRENKASIVDLKTLKTLEKISTGGNPDAILYNPAQKEVYTFNGAGKSATVFAAESGKVVATIALPGKPEFAVVDTKVGRIYCNIEDKHEVTVIDTRTHQVVSHWPIAPGEEPSGMAFDATHQRLFLGCGNKLMVMLDSATGKVLASVPIGGGVDANEFDPATQLVFSSNREGNVTIAHEDSPEKLTVVQTLKTEPGARTMALDPKTHRIYLAAGKAGAMKILVYGTEKP